MKIVVFFLLLTFFKSIQCPSLKENMPGVFQVANSYEESSSTAEMDVKRRNGDFKQIPRQKIRQKDLPLDTRLYVAPDARIEGDRDYSDGKGY